jgi:membrane protein
MDSLADGVDLVVAIVRTAIEEKIRYPAAALAYYAFVSFVPLLLLVFALVGQRLATELSRTAPQFLTPPVRDLVNQSVTTGAGRAGSGVLAILVLLWSGVNFAGDVRTVVERVEGPIDGGLGRWLRDAVVILGSVGLSILAVVVTSIVYALPPSGPLVEVASFFGLWLALTVAFVPLYAVPSTVVSSLGGALPGAVAASLGWTVIHTGIHFYAVNAAQYALYGVLSGIVVIFTGLYMAASMLLTGVIVNALVTGRQSSP